MGASLAAKGLVAKGWCYGAPARGWGGAKGGQTPPMGCTVWHRPHKFVPRSAMQKTGRANAGGGKGAKGGGWKVANPPRTGPHGLHPSFVWHKRRANARNAPTEGPKGPKEG